MGPMNFVVFQITPKLYLQNQIVSDHHNFKIDLNGAEKYQINLNVELPLWVLSFGEHNKESS